MIYWRWIPFFGKKQLIQAMTEEGGVKLGWIFWGVKGKGFGLCAQFRRFSGSYMEWLGVYDDGVIRGLGTAQEPIDEQLFHSDPLAIHADGNP